MNEVPDALVNGGDCILHYHQLDRVPRQDTLHGLQLVTRVRTVSTSQTLLTSDDIVMVDTGGINVKLLRAINGREFEVVMTADVAPFTISFSGTDTLYGKTSVMVEVQGTALRFKAITGGWILI